MKTFTDRVAFVTGGASGIGFGMVRALLAEGMKVVIADYNEEHLANAQAALSGNNMTHLIHVDVSDRTALRDAANEAVAMFGKIHLLCNNAGVGGGGAADDPEFESWDRALSINLGGVINGCKIIVPMIKAHGEGGHVVNTASMAGIVPLPGLAAYSTAKYAVRGYSESLRMALAPSGIGVSCLFPGAVRTALVPVPADNSAAPAGKDGEMLRELWDAMRAGMDPLDMGMRVVQAIRENRFHILTHIEFLEEVRDRHRAIEAAFPAGEEAPASRHRFERSRRAMVDQLFATRPKD
jgi:NAD(P)-dependent dehydrogenase (short-subunit alcohol dehydrogenase family)